MGEGSEHGGKGHENQPCACGRLLSCGEYCGKNGKSGDDRHQGVGNTDNGGILGKTDVFTDVTAVSGPYTDTDGKGIEGLPQSGKENSHHAAGGFDTAEIGDNEELNAFFRSVHGQSYYHNEYKHYEEQRHEDLVDSFDSFLYAEHEDDEAERHKHKSKNNGKVGIGDERGEGRGIIAAGNERTAAYISYGISDDPAADNRIVRKDEEGHDTAEHAHHAPGLFLRGESVDDVAGSVTTDGKFRYHRRKTDQNDHQDISYQKQCAALLTRNVRETPNIADTHRRADRRHQEAESARPVIFNVNVFHTQIVLSVKFSTGIINKK